MRHEKLDLVSAYVRAFSKRDGRSLSLQADALALGLVSLCDGVQFFRLCDPQMVSDQVMQTVLAGFFSCVLRRGAEEAPQADYREGVPDRGHGRSTPTAGADNTHDPGPAR